MNATVLVAAGTTLVVLAVVLLFARARILRQTKARVGTPKTVLLVTDLASSGMNAGGMVDLTGKVVSPNALRAPVSGRPCSVWEVSLVEITPPSYDSEEGYTTVWLTARSADLVLEYEQRREVIQDPNTGRPVQAVGPGGRVEIPREKVSFDPPGQRTDIPSPGLSWIRGDGYRPADPAVLEGIGLPADLLAKVRRNPASFVVSEGLVAQGEFLRLFQGDARNARSGPDLDKPLHVYPLSRELIGTMGAGCVRSFLTLIATVAAITGITMLLAGGSQLLDGR